MSSTAPAPRRPVLSPRGAWDALRTPLTLLVLLLGCWLAIRWGIRAFGEPIPVPPPPACQTRAATELTPSMVTVNVFNGSTERGRAATVAANLRSKGFAVEVVENTEERITATLIRGNATENPEVALLAGFFVSPTLEADGRVSHTVDVLVGPRDADQQGDDWAGMNKDAPAQLPLPSGQVCLPAEKTPSPASKPS